MKAKDLYLRPASKKRTVPCPKCGATFPVVQGSWWKRPNENQRLVLVCTRCGISGEVRKVTT